MVAFITHTHTHTAKGGKCEGMQGSRKFYICGKSGGTCRPSIKQSGIDLCDLVAERDIGGWDFVSRSLLRL